jgi:hypothetical protein
MRSFWRQWNAQIQGLKKADFWDDEWLAHLAAASAKT